MSAQPARPWIALAALGALLVIALLAFAGSPASEAQAPATRTIVLKELDKGSTFKHVRNTQTTSRRSLAMGDLIVFTNPIVDAAGQRTGRLFATCTATVGNRNFLEATMTCTAVMTLRDGTLSAVVNVSPGAPTTTGPIVGGTGAYAGARGVIVSREASNGDSDDTITLIG